MRTHNTSNLLYIPIITLAAMNLKAAEKDHDFNVLTIYEQLLFFTMLHHHLHLAGLANALLQISVHAGLDLVNIFLVSLYKY